MEKTLKQHKKIEINKENPYVLLFTYGTLREGFSNYNALLKNKSEYLGTVKTEPKYTMWGKNSHFPIVSTEGNISIEGDIFKIRVQQVLQRIHNLEGFTGEPNHPDNWYEMIPVETEWGTAYMYVQEGEFPEFGLIESGNWKNKHL